MKSDAETVFCTRTSSIGKIGIDSTAYWKLLKRETRLRLETCARVARWLAVPLATVLDWEGYWEKLSPIGKIGIPGMLEQGYSQRAFALSISVVEDTIAALWGSKCPRKATVDRIAQKLGLDPAELHQARLEMVVASQIDRRPQGPAPRNQPWNELQLRYVAHMVDHHLSRSEFIRQSGVTSLGYWFAHEGSLLSRSALEKLAAFLGIAFELALEEMGGRTASDVKADRRRPFAQKQKEIFKTEPNSPEAKRRRAISRRGGLALKGRTQSKQHVQRVLDAKMKNGSQRAAALKAARSTKRKVITGVLLRLQRANPTPDEIPLRWIRQVAEKHPGMKPSYVERLLCPYLERRGLRVQNGRPPLKEVEERNQRIDERMKDWPRDHDGGLMRGFWKAVWEAERKPETLTQASMERAFYRWRR